MPQGTWLSSIVLAIVVVVSMVVGGVLAVSINDGGDGGTPVLPSSATTLPAAAVTVRDSDAGEAVPALIAVISDLPGLVERVAPSVAMIRGSDPGGGIGSGIVLDRSGHILTNYHVVQAARDFIVELPDGTVATAELLGADEGNDLAVIHADLPASSLVPATFGDSDAVRVGEPVFAIGNPFQLEFTVTSGIISGVGRESAARPNGRSIRGVIQTDAAVNPGNSGGPLFNAQGEVIGINTAVENPFGQNFFVGVGYAVPLKTALRYIPDMIAGAEITHPQLGIQGVGLNAISAEDARVNVESGIYITMVVSGSAADRAGLSGASMPDSDGQLARGGDVITAIDGVELRNVQQLARIIDDHDVDDEVVLSVVRDGRTIEIAVFLLEWPGS